MTKLDTPTEPRTTRRSQPGRRADSLFLGLVLASSVFVVGLIVAIGLFLLLKAEPAFRSQGIRFFTNQAWLPDDPKSSFGIAALAFGTVVSSICALVLAVPVAIGSALFLTELAPRGISRWAGYLVDLLAAVPSVVFGLWGVLYLVPRLVPPAHQIDRFLGWIPVFHNRFGLYGRSIFAASVVLAIMVLPIVAAISREMFRQVPMANREAALALGATKWEMIRYSVIPYSRSGLVGAIMLGLGRALGETIAIALVLSATFTINPHILESGGNTIAANIATKFGEAGVDGQHALIASGLVLFAITLAVNVLARGVVYRSGLAAEGKP